MYVYMIQSAVCGGVRSLACAAAAAEVCSKISFILVTTY